MPNEYFGLKENDLKIDEVLADGGYSSGEALQALEDNKIQGHIPNFGQYKPTREGFIYDKENDRYTSSSGIMQQIADGKVIHAGTMNTGNASLAAALVTIQILEKANLYDGNVHTRRKTDGGAEKYNYLIQTPTLGTRPGINVSCLVYNTLLGKRLPGHFRMTKQSQNYCLNA